MSNTGPLRIWRRNWIVLGAIVAHAIFGITFLFSPSPLYTTALASLSWMYPWQVALLYLVASGLAAIPVFSSHRYSMLQEFGFIALQQWLMMMCLGTIITSVYNGQFSDGYVPEGKGNPHMFIFVDQLVMIVTVVAHSCAVVDWIWFSRK